MFAAISTLEFDTNEELGPLVLPPAVQ